MQRLKLQEIPRPTLHRVSLYIVRLNTKRATIKTGAWTVAEPEKQNLTALTVDLLSAYVSNNTVASEDLAGLVQSPYAALAKIDAPAAEAVAAPEFVPAVSISKRLATRHAPHRPLDGQPPKNPQPK